MHGFAVIALASMLLAQITHCQSGGRASVDAFEFERLGFTTRNYYLGWSDWGNVENTPVTSGPATKAAPR
jgi:thiosulfate/3-mercaptopyruvate sulfurtransferase